MQDTLNLQLFHETILSTLPWRLSQWLRVDLPSKIRALGLPVLHVQERPIAQHALDVGSPHRAKLAAQTRAADDPLIADPA